MSDSISKVDAAKRQLVTAIRMHFEDRDAVSVHTLAQAAREIFETLCKFKGVESFRQHMKEANPWIADKELQHLITGPRNFFKHANRDPNGVWVDFSDDQNDPLLLLAAEDCLRVSESSPIEVQVYQTWYFACHHEKLSDEASDRFTQSLDALFPGIAKKSRSRKKKLGLKAIREARKNKPVMTDPKTDQTKIR